MTGYARAFSWHALRHRPMPGATAPGAAAPGSTELRPNQEL